MDAGGRYSSNFGVIIKLAAPHESIGWGDQNRYNGSNDRDNYALAQFV
jgi:hypothetical protein